MTSTLIQIGKCIGQVCSCPSFIISLTVGQSVAIHILKFCISKQSVPWYYGFSMSLLPPCNMDDVKPNRKIIQPISYKFVMCEDTPPPPPPAPSRGCELMTRIVGCVWPSNLL